MPRLRASLAAALLALVTTQGGALAAPPKAPDKSAEEQAFPKEADDLQRSAMEALKRGEADAALKHANAALAFLERRFGKDHFEVGVALLLVGEIHFARRDPPSAEAPARRSVRILEKTEAAHPFELVRGLSMLAAVFESRGEYKTSIELRSRGQQIVERKLGPDDPEVIRGLRILAGIHQRAGQNDVARPLLQRILVVFEKVEGMPPDVMADLLSEIGMVDYALADHDGSEAAFRRALAIRKKMPDAKPTDLAELSNNLAEIAFARGDYPAAEPLYKEALAIFEKELGPESGEVGVVLGNLGCIELERGDFERAIPRLVRSLELREKSLGPDNIHVAGARANLAEAYKRSGNLSAAIPLVERALEIRQKFLSPEHPMVAKSLNDLATLRYSQGQVAEARVLFDRAIALREKMLGSNHPVVAESLYNLAVLRDGEGELSAARPLYERALAIREKSLGLSHHLVAPVLHHLGVLHAKAGDSALALRELSRAAEIVERHAGLVLAAGSEHERVASMSTITPILRSLVFHGLAAKEPAARELALTVILRQKGRALDAVADSMGALRKQLSPEDQALLGRLREAQQKLAALVLYGKTDDGAKVRAEVAQHEAAVDRLEAEISAKSAPYRVLGEPVTMAGVKAALPGGSALVEIIESAPYPSPPNSPGVGHYVAYVLRGEGDVVAVDLGPSASIDDGVKALRGALTDPGRADAKALARGLDERVMRPIRKALGPARAVFLSPDGQLNLIPFEALVDEDEKYLVDRYSFTYLTSGRDLLRRALRRPSRSGPVVLANPDFGVAAPVAAAGSPASRGAGIGDFAHVSFPPLPGTAEEGKVIRGALRGSAFHEGARAAKTVLTAIAGPRILHVATHGFFLGSTEAGASGGRGLVLEAGSTPAIRPLSENPLLRSGIALASANRQGPEKAAGILTALEASGLDLDGTKLVALSACETGVGEVRAGEGVYGLRRALVIAGAETVLMSLWKVDDEATRDLMVSYYQRIEAGEGRSEALRAARLGMMSEEGRAHPFYWASFIVSGDPSTLEGTSAPAPGVVPKGARGCACRIGDQYEETAGQWGACLGIGLMALGALRSRRRRS